MREMTRETEGKDRKVETDREWGEKERRARESM